MHNLIHGIVSQGGGGGGIPFTEDWAESASTGAGWTSFVADGSSGFTAESDGASVAIIPEDVSGLDGDTVQYTFNIDTISAGSLTFSVDESGVDAGDAVDNGVVTKVTGGIRSGAQAIFTSTGVKVVVIRTKKTNGLNALRPKFKSTDSGQNIVISGFEAIGGQVADYWTGAIYGYDFNYPYFLDDNLVDDTDLAFVRTDSSSTIGELGGGIIPKLGDGCFYNSGTLFANLANVASVSYDMEPAIDLADWTENQATAEVVTFGGYSNVLKVTCGAPTSGYKGVGVAFGAATYANYRAEIYVPSSNTNVDGVYAYKSVSSTLRNEIPTPDTWKKVSWQATSGPSSLHFYGSDNGATTGIAFGGDVFYIRLLKIVETNQGGAAGTGHMGLHTTYPDFSVSMWVRPRSGSMGATKFALAQCNTATTSTSERNLAIGKSSLDQWYAGVRNTVSGFPNVSGGSVVVDTYAHLYVSVKQGEYLRFWADGVYLGETDLTGMTMYTPASVVTRLGGVGNVYWAGEIDQLLVYDYAGGQPDVDYLFAGGDGIETSLIQATKQSYSAETESYALNVSNAGGAVSEASLVALDAFFASIGSSVIGKMEHLYFPLSEGIAGCKVPIIGGSTEMSSGGTLSYSLTAGIGATTTRVRTGISDLTARFSTNGAAFGIYHSNIPATGTGLKYVGTLNSSNFAMGSGSGDSYFYAIGNFRPWSIGGARATGMHIVNTEAGVVKLYRNNTVLHSNTPGSLAITDALFDYKYDTTGLAFHGGFLSQALTSAEQTMLNNAFNALVAAVRV